MKIRVVITVLVVLGIPPIANSIQEGLCVGMGYTSKEGTAIGPEFSSMGFESFFSTILSSFWVANHWEPSSAWDSITVDVKPVTEKIGGGKAKPLNGWLKIEVKMKRKEDFFMALAIWVLSDERETIGEFLGAKHQKCEGLTGNWNEPGSEFVPCGATPANLPTNPGIFVYTDPWLKKKKNSIQVLWRASFSYCDKPKKFQILLAANNRDFFKKVNPKIFTPNKPYGPEIHASGWLQPRFYGAASVPRRGSQNLVCKLGFSSISDTASWLTQAVPKDNFFKPQKGNWSTKLWTSSTMFDPSVYLQRIVCRGEAGFTPFAGRCPKLINSVSSDDYGENLLAGKTELHKCLGKSSNFEDAEKKLFKDGYSSYVKTYNEMLKKAKQPPSPTEDDIKNTARSLDIPETLLEIVDEQSAFTNEDDADSFNDTSLACTEQNFSRQNELGICIGSLPGKVVYGIRQWHATAALLYVVILNPVNIYMARYLKGAFFPTETQHIPMKQWYFMHIFVIVPMMCTFTSGMASIQRQLDLFGVSRTPMAEFHRNFGQLLCFLPVIQICTGFVRPIEISARKVWIAAHWFGGVLLYYGSLVLCILTYRIPGSPTSFRLHLNEPEFENIFNHPAAMMLSFWLILDVTIHIVLTLRVRAFDNRHGFARASYFPVIIPIMVDVEDRTIQNYEDLMREEIVQRGLFIVYSLITILVFISTCIATYVFNTEVKQGFGPMTCTHDEFGNLFQPGHGNMSRIESSCYTNTSILL